VWIYPVFAAHHTPEWLYWSYPTSCFLTASVHMACYLTVRKKMLPKEVKDG